MSNGDQPAHNLALTFLTNKQLECIPVAQKIDAKHVRYLDSAGNELTKEEAMALAGGVIYYQEATDPHKGRFRQRGAFVSEDVARAIVELIACSRAGSDVGDIHDLASKDECLDRIKEERESLPTKNGEHARPGVGDMVRIMIENEAGFQDPIREGTKGLTGTVVQDDDSSHPFQITFADGKSSWYSEHWVKLIAKEEVPQEKLPDLEATSSVDVKATVEDTQQPKHGQDEQSDEDKVQVIKTSKDFWRVQIEAIYRRRNPHKLKDVPRLLEDNKDKELMLYLRICSRYDIDPKKLYATDPQAWDNEDKYQKELNADGGQPWLSELVSSVWLNALVGFLLAVFAVVCFGRM